MYALHNGEREKIVCSALGEEGRVISPQGGSNWLCEIKKKSGQRRVGEVDGSGMVRRGGICEFTQGEKWGNWSISPSWILNFYDQGEARRRKSKNGRLFFIPGIVFVIRMDVWQPRTVWHYRSPRPNLSIAGHLATLL